VTPGEGPKFQQENLLPVLEHLDHDGGPATSGSILPFAQPSSADIRFGSDDDELAA
jgi:hypothetical protein